jgi:recombination protein RecA
MLIVDKRKGDYMPMHEVIPTPSVGLNRALGGGLNTGASHLFWGTPSAGKSTMSFRILASAQKMGYRPVIIDSEYSFNEEYAAKCGIDIDDIVVVQSTIVEDVLKSIYPYLTHEEEKHVFLFDSLSNLLRAEAYDKPEGSKAIGLAARSQGALVQQLLNYLHKERNMMIFIAHQTMDLSGMYAVTKAKIGNEVRHNMHNIVKLFLSMSSKEMERDDRNMITSQRVTWEIEKTKQGATIGTKGQYYLKPQDAMLDQFRELLDIAVEMNIIERRGAWFFYGEEKWNGIGKIELTEKQIEEISAKILVG